MTELTDTERETLSRLFGYVPDPEPLEQMLAAVEAILTARLARVEALAATWEGKGIGSGPHGSQQAADAAALRAALAAPTLPEVQS